ncbi:MAG: arginine--tRNA ligase [Solirubrobacterales bacterium]|nr:arginine--tRNA ligase [Solirubrobacterales bacterium]OJU95429.1 MAG: arginine--tRNA ligase [Solirubrobacterales bacterium 67-14]
MNAPSSDPVDVLHSAVTAAAWRLAGDEGVSPALDPSPRPEMGDYSTNAAMMLAKPLGKPPREIAAELAAAIEAELGAALEKTEIAGPGFINLFLGDAWYREAAASMSATGAAAVSPVARPERVIVEFVSANPTGPLTAASGRHAAYGDALSRLLKETGHAVTTEYYVNDGGTQVDNFAASIAARMTGDEPPEDGYKGTYVNELAERAATEGHDPTDLERLARTGVEWMVEGIRGSLENFGVRMDDFFSERSLYEDNLVDRGIQRLRDNGHVFEEDGAVWLRTTDFGDDKDRVLVRSSGEVTYFGADVAYHVDKIERGNDRLIDVLGADHHGYVPRMAAAIQSLEGDRAEFEAQIMQLIHLVEGGQRTKMSKRAGDIVTLDELTQDIGVDAARWFLLARSHNQTIDLDLDLARSQSSENPVYYVQYAHARIQSILRKAAEEGGPGSGDPLAAPVDPSEKALVSKVLEFPAEVHEAAEKRAPHRICAYASEVAAAFHAFYRDCQVVGAEGEGVQAARIQLCGVTAETIKRSLGLLGITAPDRM